MCLLVVFLLVLLIANPSVVIRRLLVLRTAMFLLPFLSLSQTDRTTTPIGFIISLTVIIRTIITVITVSMPVAITIVMNIASTSSRTIAYCYYELRLLLLPLLLLPLLFSLIVLYLFS